MLRSKMAVAVVCVAALAACVSAKQFEDDKSADGRGWFTVEKREDGKFFGNLSGYTANMDPRGEAVGREFWSRAASFCKAEAEHLTDGLCIIHRYVNTPPETELGQCKMGLFRCKEAA